VSGKGNSSSAPHYYEMSHRDLGLGSFFGMRFYEAFISDKKGHWPRIHILDIHILFLEFS
jgi:hypothetical protein